MDDTFTNWTPLGHLRVTDLPRLRACWAVYAFRDRRNGDTLKFGERGTLRLRIFGNYLGGIGGSGPDAATQFVHRKLFDEDMIDHVDIAWKVVKDKATAKRIEHTLRQDYKKTQGRRPLWDRNG